MVKTISYILPELMYYRGIYLTRLEIYGKEDVIQTSKSSKEFSRRFLSLPTKGKVEKTTSDKLMFSIFDKYLF